MTAANPALTPFPSPPRFRKPKVQELLLVLLQLLQLLVLGAAAGGLQDHTSTRVTSLPGFDPSTAGGPLPEMHSGYISVPSPNPKIIAHTHYILTIASPTAPTLSWQQGGPGGSSLIGFFTENGALTLNDGSFASPSYAQTQTPTVFLNPTSWHKLNLNTLYLEHPAPTGFSFCTDAATSQPTNCEWDDWSQANTSYAFFVEFFQNEWPELAGNPFYMAGESYAGILVPTLAMKLLEERNASNQHLAPWSVSKLLLNDICIGPLGTMCTPYSGWIATQIALEYRWKRGQLPDEIYDKANRLCADFWANPTREGPPNGSACREILIDPTRPCLNVTGDSYLVRRTLNGGGGQKPSSSTTHTCTHAKHCFSHHFSPTTHSQHKDWRRV